MSAQRVVVHLPSSGPISASDFVAYAKGERVQVCRPSIVRVTERVQLELHLTQPSVGPTNLAELEPSPHRIPVLVLPVHEGVVSAQLSREHQALAVEVAAAVGVMQAAWAWDERAQFPVEVNGVPYTVGPSYREERMWEVSVVS